MQRILAILAATCWLALPALASDLQLPFRSSPCHQAILVEGRVNGKVVLFILDTGAARTVLSNEVADVQPLELTLSRFSQSGPGFQGEATLREATLKLGQHTWYDRPVVVMNLEKVREVYGVKVDGLLGQDILREFSSVLIDFKKRRIVLSR